MSEHHAVFMGTCGLEVQSHGCNKSVPFDALAVHQGVRQHGLKLRVAPGFVPRNMQGCYLRSYSKSISICVCVGGLVKDIVTTTVMLL